ncbi:MAG: hypothetical protein JWQ16_2234 [Novosphingobium sp.]|nr:hypothetical protein [Novosphingobium sp.]
MTKISDLPFAGPITGGETAPIVQGGETVQAYLVDLPGSDGSTAVVGEISYTDELAVAEPLPLIKHRVAVRYPANFASNMGTCLVPPSADYTIYLRKYLANRTDAGDAGTITIHPDGSFTRTTPGGVDLLCDPGDVLRPRGGATMLGARDVSELLIGVKQ